MAYSTMLIAATVFVACLSLSTAQDFCFHNGRVRQHGEQFTVPGYSRCMKYICWNRQVTLEAEGCEDGDQCHNVGSVFEHQCTRYRCTKTTHGRFDFYKADLISSQCQDSSGVCRDPGQIFPYVLRGVHHRSCTCRRLTATSIQYECSVPYTHRGKREATTEEETSDPLTIEIKPIKVPTCLMNHPTPPPKNN